MAHRRLLILTIVYGLIALVLLLGGVLQAAGAALQNAQATWNGPRVILSWVQRSDANKVTVMRCRTGEACHLVATYDAKPGDHQITDIYARGDDTYWIGEFHDDNGALTIYGWSGPYAVPMQPLYLPFITKEV